MSQQNNQTSDRRQFLARAGKAAVSIAAAAGAAALLYDRSGPGAEGKAQKLVTFPDFSVPPRQGQVISIVQGSDRVKTVRKAVELLGGIERFVKPGDTVIIKPNVAFATPPLLGATADPQLVAEVVRLCYQACRAKKVIVTDNPINAPASCFTISGISKAAAAAGAELIMPGDSFFRHITLTGARNILDWPVYYEPFAKADKLIGISPVKHHQRAGASMSIKNWYGLLGGRRNVFHQDINGIISELAMLVRPTLVILDGTRTMITNGPTGGAVSDLKATNTLIASCDMVAADAFGCSLLGLKPADLPYLALAQKAGAGTTDYQSLKPLFAGAS